MVGASRRTRIPSKARSSTLERDIRCPRCGCSTLAAGEVHHRRSRRVQDTHTHALGNLVRLDPSCHRWITEHPAEAARDGWIVSAYEADPSSVPMKTFAGWRYHLDDGSIVVPPATPALLN